MLEHIIGLLQSASHTVFCNSLFRIFLFFLGGGGGWWWSVMIIYLPYKVQTCSHQYTCTDESSFLTCKLRFNDKVIYNDMNNYSFVFIIVLCLDICNDLFVYRCLFSMTTKCKLIEGRKKPTYFTNIVYCESHVTFVKSIHHNIMI